MRRWRGLLTARGRWAVLAPVSFLLAGVLFAISAQTADGTDLRAGRRANLAQLIGAEEAAVAAQSDRLTAVQRQIQTMEQQAGGGDQEVSDAQGAGNVLAPAAGLTPVVGPGLTVALNDAPTRADGTLPLGARPNDVVVHQSDVQAVVNAMWAGGATAITLMGERIIATSAVRCVGNVLLLRGRTFSPPFQVAAVGDEKGMRAALDASPNVALFVQAVNYFGLGYDVAAHDQLMLPAYDGPLGISLATAVPG